MVESHDNSLFRFFDLPREIRDVIYSRIMYFHDDFYIDLGPKGSLPNYAGDRRAQLYNRYQELVSFFTVSRQFCDEALPIFWHGNTFHVNRHVRLVYTPEMPDEVVTTLDFIGHPGKMCITRLYVPILCTVFVKKAEGSKKEGEHVTDLGITIKRLLDILPNLEMLDMSFWCSVKREDYPGEEKTGAVLEKALEGLLEFSWPMGCAQSSDPPKLVIGLFGRIHGRPLRTAKEQKTHIN